MSYRAAQEFTVRWTDGFTWKADAAAFDRVTRALAALRGLIVGLAPVLARWEALAARGPELRVDDFAPTEADRAVLTAALTRALDDVRAEEGGDAEGHAAFVSALGSLHELFVTDVTKG